MLSDVLEVRPAGERWLVIYNGEPRASFVTRTRALIMARLWAKAVRGALTVTDAEGRVVEQRAFGRDTDKG